MLNFNGTLTQCNICKNEYTSSYFEAMPGYKVYVCSHCLEAAKHNFIWICLNCGRSFQRQKKEVMGRRNGYGIKEAFLLRDAQIIQGLHMCIHCNPRGVSDYIKSRKEPAESSA